MTTKASDIQDGSEPAGKALTDALKSALSGAGGAIKFDVIAGGAADTDLTLTGIDYTAAHITAGTADVVLAIIRFDVATDTGTSATGNKVQDVTNLTAEAQGATAASKIQLASTDTTGDKLLVVYADVSH